MTDEDRVRRALAYEIEPWTPDPGTLMRDGRRRAWARRGAAAGAALAVAVTMTGVAVAVGRTGGGEPPVADAPRPLVRMPAATASPTTPARPSPKPCRTVVRPDYEVRATPTAPARPGTPRRAVPATPTAKPSLWICVGLPYPSRPPSVRKCEALVIPATPRTTVLPRCVVYPVARPTTPVPTSVPAGE